MLSWAKLFGPTLANHSYLVRDVKLGKFEFSSVATQATEILVALKKLGEPLEPKVSSLSISSLSQPRRHL